MRYRVIVGGNIGPDNRRIEVDDILEDLSKAQAKSLIGIGMIVEDTDGPELP